MPSAQHPHQHLLPHKPHKPHKPAPADAAAAQLIEQAEHWGARFDVAAASAGRADAAATAGAARSLLQLATHLSHHRQLCRRGDVRACLAKHVPPALITHLLGAGDVALGVALAALATCARSAPYLVPAAAIPRLLQLVAGGDTRHAGAAAKVVTLQLSAEWRFSAVWRHWTAAGATARVCEQLQAVCGEADSGRAADVTAGVGQLALLARLAELAPGHEVAQQLAGSEQAAAASLRLLLRLASHQPSLAGTPASLQLQDSTCLLLAAMSRAPGLALALEAGSALSGQLLQLLRRVLAKQPSQPGDLPRSWAHAAEAASLPVLWRGAAQPGGAAGQPGDGGLAAHERGQLLADIAAAAAATLTVDITNSQAAAATNAAAAGLLAAALLPAPGCEFGGRRRCASRYLGAVLDSGSAHVLLHALASCADANSSALGWQVLRLVCAQSAAARREGSSGSSSDADGGGEQPRGVPLAQLHRVVAAYSAHARSIVSTPCLMGSLHVLLCQAALPAGAAGNDGGDEQLLLATAKLLERVQALQQHAGAATAQAPAASELPCQLVAAVYGALAVAVQLRERAAAALTPPLCPLALCALSLAAAALRTLLPAALSGPRAEGALECALAAAQALTLLARTSRALLPGLLGAAGQTAACSLPGARAAAAEALAALDGPLQAALADLVAAVGAAGSEPAAATLQAALRHGLRQELGCWAAAALAACYGELGAGGWLGAAVAAYRQPGAPFADVEVALGDGAALPARGHAALLAAGCPVLGQQLLRAPAGGVRLLRLSAAVDSAAVQLALDAAYGGAARLPAAGLASQLRVAASGFAAAAAAAAGHASAAQQQQLLGEARRLTQQLTEQQRTAREQLATLAPLALRLQLPLLAAVSRDSLPQPGQQLPALHPRLAALLPQQLLLVHEAGGGEQQAPATAPAGRHQPCSAYLQLLAACQPPPHELAAEQLAAGEPRELADVLLAAPAVVCTPDGSQQAVTALLPAHRAVLAAACPYFGALLSERWAAQQDEAGSSCSVLALPEADVHVAAALLAYLHTGALAVGLPEHVRAWSAAGHDAQQHGAAAAQPSGCCAPCHRARVLLRLWRCAELLLLPELQDMCLSAVEAATDQLDCACGLALLDDCWQLGAAAAADAIAARLVARHDKDAAAAAPEWAALDAGMRDGLAAAWAERAARDDAAELAPAPPDGPPALARSRSPGAGGAAAQSRQAAAAADSLHRAACALHRALRPLVEGPGER